MPTYQADQAKVDTLSPQLSALYKSDMAAGKSGAQTVVDMMQLQLSQTQSYWSAVDPDHLQSTDPKAVTKGELNLLQQDMAQTSNTASVPS